MRAAHFRGEKSQIECFTPLLCVKKEFTQPSITDAWKSYSGNHFVCNTSNVSFLLSE